MYCAIIIVTIAHIAATFAVVRTMYLINKDYMTLYDYFGVELANIGRADRFLVSVSNGQVAALSD